MAKFEERAYPEKGYQPLLPWGGVGGGYLGFINPALDILYRRLSIVELVLLYNLAQLLLEALSLFFLDVSDEVETCLAENIYPVLCYAQLSPLLDAALWNLHFWLKLREEHYFLDELLTCHQHGETVDTDTDT